MKPSPNDEHPELAVRNASSGILLFAFYSAIYAAFVALAAFSPQTIAQATPLGPNVAILYGFGLILGAFLLALLYMVLCNRNAQQIERKEQP